MSVYLGTVQAECTRERKGGLKMELEKAKAIAKEIVYWLLPGCERAIIAGSIRRQKPEVGDVEILCIPQFVDGIDQLDKVVKVLVAQGRLDYRLNKLGRRAYGPKNKLMVHVPSGMGVDIFSTDENCWWVSLVVRTGGEKTNKEIAARALRQGMQFHAYGRGFTLADGSELVCRSEADVFKAVGLRYFEPWERE
jgi:DNA polymerase/3'-5' exonuclease PolX